MQGINRKLGRRGVWLRMLAMLHFHVYVWLKMLQKHETSSGELISCIWRHADPGNRGKWV